MGTLFVPSDSGLAGPAIALGYGVGGAIIGLILGLVLIRRLSYDQLRLVLIGAVIIALLACAWLIYRVRIVQQGSAKQQFEDDTVLFSPPLVPDIRLAPTGSGQARHSLTSNMALSP